MSDNLTLCQVKDKYYELPKGKRWLLDSDNPGFIDDQCTNIAQIGYKLQEIILQKHPDAYSVQEAKSEASLALAIRLDTLFDTLNKAELAIADLINTASQVTANE